jgi:hypothetical protein
MLPLYQLAGYQATGPRGRRDDPGRHLANCNAFEKMTASSTFAKPGREIDTHDPTSSFETMARKADATEKEIAAETLAASHYDAEPRLARIIHFTCSPDIEARPAEPIKLLEVNSAASHTKRLTTLHFKSSPSIPFPVDLIEVTPDQYDRIQAKKLKLPAMWQIGKEIPKPGA